MHSIDRRRLLAGCGGAVLAPWFSTRLAAQEPAMRSWPLGRRGAPASTTLRRRPTAASGSLAQGAATSAGSTRRPGAPN